MKMRKVFAAFLVAICMVSLACTLGVSAESTNRVTIEADASIQQGSYGYAYVYLDNLKDLASLTVAVHYDAEKVMVLDSYNMVGCDMYDSSVMDGRLQFSYIFGDEGSDSKSILFYFYYMIQEDATVGDTFFDVVVSDAFTGELETVEISGSRCNFTVTERVENKYAYVWGDSDISTAVKQEFELHYYLNDWQIASGSVTLSYDPELFEFVEFSNGGFLADKMVDVNASLEGSVYLSFLSTEYNYNNDFFSVRFRTLKNVSDSSEIKLKVAEFYDLNLKPIICDGHTTNVDIAFDETHTEDAPAMLLSSSYDVATGKVTLTVALEKDSYLGAGDFVIYFDPETLTYLSHTKEFSPTFFNVNTSHIAEGMLKFSIISMTDITDAQTVLTVTFDAKRTCEDQLAQFEIMGSGLTDSLTNAIMLNFVDCDVTIPLQHICEGWVNTDAQTHWQNCSACGQKVNESEHDYPEDQDACSVCGHLKYMIGDVNNDTIVNRQDAIYLLYHVLLGNKRYPVNQPVDFNDDGNTTRADAIYLLYHVLLPSKYPLG